MNYPDGSTGPFLIFQSSGLDCALALKAVHEVVPMAALFAPPGMPCASGLLAIREAGGYTIAEDQSTAVVYGMPAVAVKLGAVCESLPLGSMARRALELAPRSAEAA
jgi:CheB methylesterase